MVREVVKADFGVQFDPTAIGQWKIPLQEIRPSIAHELSEATLYDGHTSKKHISYEELHHSASEKTNGGDVAVTLGVEELFDAKDALKEEVDQLKKRWMWWMRYYPRTMHGRTSMTGGSADGGELLSPFFAPCDRVD